jgi:hypothetical protein
MELVVGIHVAVRIPAGVKMPPTRVNLREPHPPLDEPPGDQTFSAILLGGWIVEPVEPFGLLGLFGNIDGLWCRSLHPKCQFVTHNARHQLDIIGSGGSVQFVKFREQIELPPLLGRGDPFGRFQKQNRVAGRPELRPLESCRHESGINNLEADKRPRKHHRWINLKVPG